MMIKNTEKLETNIKSELNEGTQQNKNMYCKNETCSHKMRDKLQNFISKL